MRRALCRRLSGIPRARAVAAAGRIGLLSGSPAERAATAAHRRLTAAPAGGQGRKVIDPKRRGRAAVCFAAWAAAFAAAPVAAQQEIPVAQHDTAAPQPEIVVTGLPAAMDPARLPAASDSLDGGDLRRGGSIAAGRPVTTISG